MVIRRVPCGAHYDDSVSETGVKRFETGVTRQYGRVFDEVAAEYDRVRPAYPDELVDHACAVAGLKGGDRVLEIGCGSGQLTRALLARGLRVTAIEPGRNLIMLARQNLEGAGLVEFENARFEDAALPHGQFLAVFSASAVHWVDPAVGWRKIADVLASHGTLALLSYFGLDDQRSSGDQEALLAAMRKVAPDMAATWPAYRDLDAMLAGAQQRRANVSAMWAWLGHYNLAQDYAGPLFDDAQIAVMPTLVEHTADELNAIIATMSYYARLSPEQRQALAQGYTAICERLRRPVRSSIVTVLVTARRSAN
jgi:SAM-dependent methyltransferase